jgi:DNA-binding HxlR family transcriptional regulator
MALKVRKTKVQPPVAGCPMSACMSLLGGAWTPDVIWHLTEGPRRFSELRRDLPVISAKVLSARLKDLEARGVVIRDVMPTSPPSVEYSLSDLGLELAPAIRAIVEVGHKLKLRAAAVAEAPEAS